MSNETQQDTPGHDIGLTDVILAMDVVDTLRHEQQLVRHALNEDAREEALVARVRAAYSAQGIDVSEAMIIAGVAALKARQYAYEPPPAGLRTSLLKAWINRQRIGGGLAVVAVLAAIIAAGWVGFVEWPAQRALTEQANTLNQNVSLANAELTSLQQRRARLARNLSARESLAGNGDIFAATISTAQRGLADAKTALIAAATLEQLPVLDGDNLVSREAEVEDLLTRQRAALSGASNALDEVETAITLLDNLTDLPDRLAGLRDDAKSLAVESGLDARIDNIYDNAMASLRQGDASGAALAADTLADMVTRLGQTYQVRVVSRPGVLSGVIREPPNNARASNYYLVVEALDTNNRAVPLEIRSEEDGSTRTVRLWGIRVSEAEFNRIREDKSDDGIIQQSLVGEKPRGYLDIGYTIDTPGGFINRWEGLR